MNIIQMALLGLIAVFGWCEYVDGINKSTRPIVMCTLVGLVLGDLPQGIVIGGTLELATMGMMGIGISIPINITIAGVLGARLCHFERAFAQSRSGACHPHWHCLSTLGALGNDGL